MWHGHYKATEGGGEAQHQEGGWRRAQEEDDQQAAEEDPHRSREAGEQGEAAEAALGGAPDGFAFESGVHHVIVLLEREGRLRLELPRLVHQDLPRDPRRGLERRTMRGLGLGLPLALPHRGANHTRNHRGSQGLPRRPRAPTLRAP